MEANVILNISVVSVASLDTDRTIVDVLTGKGVRLILTMTTQDTETVTGKRGTSQKRLL